jgi:hypothetical protein
LLLALILPAAGCNKASQDSGSASSGAETAPVVAEKPAPRETTGGNAPVVTPPPPAADVSDFAYTAFNGTSGQFSALTGKPTVVNLWAVW